MRPVDLVANANHAFYNRTFDNLTGVRLLVIDDLSWSGPTKNATFLFYRGAYRWGLNKKLQKPEKPKSVGNLPTGATPHLFPPPYLTSTQDLGVNDSRNTGRIVLHPRILMVQKAPDSGKLRVVLPPDEASDAVAAWHDGEWNGVPLNTLPKEIRERLKKQIEQTDTVPGVPDASGTFYGYRGAIKDLETAGGGYCAYCESKRQDARTMDVEHRLPKQFYDSEILRWENFLLACDACNSSFKGSQPTRGFGIEKAISHYHPLAAVVYPTQANQLNISPVVPPTVARVPYWEMRQACELYALWPSQDDGGTPGCPVAAAAPADPTNYGLLAMRYQLREYRDDGTLVGEIDGKDACDERNKVVRDGTGGMVRANVWDSSRVPARLRERNVRVDAVPSNPGTTSAGFNHRKLQAAHKTEAMVGLNQLANALGDRRQLERTRAWFRALNALQLLTNTRKKFREKTWESLLESAETGYYSVWITVFKKASGEKKAISLARRLQARADAGGTPFHYSGTNVEKSVVAHIPSL